MQRGGGEKKAFVSAVNGRMPFGTERKKKGESIRNRYFGIGGGGGEKQMFMNQPEGRKKCISLDGKGPCDSKVNSSKGKEGGKKRASASWRHKKKSYICDRLKKEKS